MDTWTVVVEAPDARAGGLFVAIDAGLPRRHGLEIQVLQRPRGETPWALLADGRAQAALVSDAVVAAWGEGHDAVILATTHGPDARLLVTREDGGLGNASALAAVGEERLPRWPEGVPVAWILAAQDHGLYPGRWRGGVAGFQDFLAGEVVAWPATWRERAQLAELGVRVRPLLQPSVGFGVALVCSRTAWNTQQAEGYRLRELVFEGWRLAREQPALLVAALAARTTAPARGLLMHEAELALAALDPTPLPDRGEITDLATRLQAAGIPLLLPAVFSADSVSAGPMGTWILVGILIVLLLLLMGQLRWNRPGRRDETKASAAQRHLLSDLPDLDGWEIGVHYRPHSEVSGDFYVCAALADSRALIVVGDVSGHGVQAAIVASAVAKAGEVLAPAQRSLGDWLIALDGAIAGDLLHGQFVTLVAVALDPWSGAVECARAGHPPAYLLDDDKGQQHEIGPIGVALGLSTREAFAEQVRTQSLHLAPGSDLLLFTDGLTEVFDRAGEEYGAEGLKRSIARHRTQGAQVFVDAIARDAIAHAAHGPEDDLTALVVRRVRATAIPPKELAG